MAILTRVIMMSAVSGRRGPKGKFLIFAVAAIGILSSSGENHPNLTGLWSLVPLLWLETESRRSAFLVAFTFYLSLSRGIVPGSYVFFRDGSLVRAFTLWVSSAAALALPWGLFWSERSSAKRTCGVIPALLSSLPPPLGLIGWGNPLVGAGLFFPGFGWYGLLLMLAFYAAAAANRKLRRGGIVLILMMTPFLSVPVLPERTTIGDVTVLKLDTSFGRMASGSGDFESQYEREREIFQYVKERERNGELKEADVVILPETIIGRMNPTNMRRWRKFFAPFAESGAVFVAGGEIPTDRGKKYNNVMISFEKNGMNQTALQRFPVPFSMFRPFSGEGANAYLSSPGEISVMEFQDKKLGFLVCYEQFLTWPFLSLVSRKPDIIIAPSNLWWCKDTSLPGIQEATVRLWASLFGITVIMSKNI